MAIVLIEGCDHLNDGTLKGWSSGWESFQTGRLAGQCGRISQANSYTVAKSLPSTYATLFVGFAFKFAQAPSGTRHIAALMQGGNYQWSLSMNTSRVLLVRNGGGTVVATGTTALSTGTWYYLEFKAVQAGASGTCEVRVNGVTEIASTTGNFGSSNFDAIRFGQTDSNSGFGLRDYDDIYVADTSGSSPRNTWLGDVRVETLYPTADGNSTAWTASAGSDYACVDEAVANGDTDYISSANAGDVDTFTTGDLSVSTGTVFAVQVNLWARKDDAGVRTIAPVIRQGSTDYVGGSQNLGTTYLDKTEIYNQDPTGSDWTISNVNADEFGVKLVA